MLLETFTLTGLPNFGGSYAPITFTSALHPLLTAGSTYYLYEAETGTEWNAWNVNSIVETGPHLYSADNITYANGSNGQGAFRVTVTPAATPEPGSIALLVGMSISGAGFLIRRRRNANEAV